MLFSALLFCFGGCSGESDKLPIGHETFRTYKFDECIVKIVIDQERRLDFGEYRKLQHGLIPDVVINIMRSGIYPLFQIDMTRSGNLTREYYFFFAALCENKLKYVNSIVQDYFLPKREYEAITYEAFEITGNELPDGVGGYRGLWVDR